MHKLKEMLMNELYEYEEKAKKMPGGKISAQELDKIQKLTDTVKNICKIDMLEEDDGYSEASDWMGEGRMYGTSYARERGKNVKRDNMGRYSSDESSYRGKAYDDGSSYENDRGGSVRGGYSREGAKQHLIDKAEQMLEMATGEEERKAIHQFIKKLEEA